MSLNKDPESWARVSVEAVMAGSAAQVANVLRMAIDDILRLSQAKLALDEIASLSPKLDRVGQIARDALRVL